MASMDPACWRARWQDRQIGFHEGVPNAFLAKHADRLEGCRRILVPLCGKTEDLAFLASRGHEVVGIELVESAVREFFAEHHITPEVSQRAGFATYTAGSITVLAGDLFSASPALVGEIDGIYDRAAMIALPHDARARYVEHLRAIAPGATRMLLVTVEYPQELMAGPPFSVDEAEVSARYRNAPIELLDQGGDPRNRAEGKLVEKCYFVGLTAARPMP
jgi:thiopurine S-methyltransferase